MIRQWIPDSWSGDRKCTGPRGAMANSQNWQLMTSGRSQVLATRNFGDWYTVVGEVPWVILQRIQIHEWVIRSPRSSPQQPMRVAFICCDTQRVTDYTQPSRRRTLHRGTISPSDIFPLYNYLRKKSVTSLMSVSPVR